MGCDAVSIIYQTEDAVPFSVKKIMYTTTSNNNNNILYFNLFLAIYGNYR